jgi:nitrogen regulatory protein PII
MKKIEAIISPGKLENVREALSSAGIQGITVTEVRDFGKQKEHKEIYRNSEYEVSYLIRFKLEAIVPQHLAPKAVSIIVKWGYSGKKEHDKIFISSVNNVSQVYPNGTGESVRWIKRINNNSTNSHNERSFMKIFLTIMVSFITISFSTGIRAAQGAEPCNQW